MFQNIDEKYLIVTKCTWQQLFRFRTVYLNGLADVLKSSINIVVINVQTCEDVWPNCHTYTVYCPGERSSREPNARTVLENCAGTCGLCEDGQKQVEGMR